MCNNIRVKWKFDEKEIEFSSLGELWFYGVCHDAGCKISIPKHDNGIDFVVNGIAVQTKSDNSFSDSTATKAFIVAKKSLVGKYNNGQFLVVNCCEPKKFFQFKYFADLKTYDWRRCDFSFLNDVLGLPFGALENNIDRYNGIRGRIIEAVSNKRPIVQSEIEKEFVVVNSSDVVSGVKEGKLVVLGPVSADGLGNAIDSIETDFFSLKQGNTSNQPKKNVTRLIYSLKTVAMFGSLQSNKIAFLRRCFTSFVNGFDESNGAKSIFRRETKRYKGKISNLSFKKWLIENKYMTKDGEIVLPESEKTDAPCSAPAPTPAPTPAPIEEPEQTALPLEAPAEAAAAEPEVEEVKQVEEEPKIEPPFLPSLPPQCGLQMSIESKMFLFVCAIIAIEALVRIAGMLGR